MAENNPASFMATLQFKVNGDSHSLEIDTRTTLLALLRGQLDLTGAKPACEVGECGACTVLLDHQPVNACQMLALQANGREVVTVEGLGGRPEFEALVKSFVNVDGGQCGYCTPGFAVAAYALLRAQSAVSSPQEAVSSPREAVSSGRGAESSPHEAVSSARDAVDAARIRWALVGHICRCNAYDRIVEAVREAAAELQNQRTANTA